MRQNATGSRRSDGGHFYGVVVKEWRIANLGFSESVYAPGARIRRHSHPNAYFCILLQGGYREIYRSGVREYGPGSVVFHPSGEVHADQFLDGGGHIFRFELADHTCDARLANRVAQRADLRNGRIRCLAARLYSESRHPDRFSPLAAEALALEIVGEATRQGLVNDTPRMPRWLVQAIELLHNTLPDNLTVERIATVVGVHPVHLARVFRRHCGYSVGEYARNWRVDIASHQLATSSRRIAEIAAASGFADQSHLCRTFKTIGGLAPNAFRAVFRRP